MRKIAGSQLQSCGSGSTGDMGLVGGLHVEDEAITGIVNNGAYLDRNEGRPGKIKGVKNAAPSRNIVTILQQGIEQCSKVVVIRVFYS